MLTNLFFNNLITTSAGGRITKEKPAAGNTGPVTDRIPWFCIDRGRLVVGSHGLALIQEAGLVEIPTGMFTALLLEPGVTVTHEAVRACAENRTLLLWIGEGGTRFYAASSCHADARRLLASLAGESASCPQALQAWYRERAMATGLDWTQRTDDTPLDREVVDIDQVQLVRRILSLPTMT